jgi:hypothetical protein
MAIRPPPDCLVLLAETMDVPAQPSHSPQLALCVAYKCRSVASWHSQAISPSTKSSPFGTKEPGFQTSGYCGNVERCRKPTELTWLDIRSLREKLEGQRMLSNQSACDVRWAVANAAMKCTVSSLRVATAI